MIEIDGAVDIVRRTGRPLTDLASARMYVLFLLPLTFSLLGLVAAVGVFRTREWGRQTALFLATVPVTVYSLLIVYHPVYMASEERRVSKATPWG